MFLGSAAYNCAKFDVGDTLPLFETSIKDDIECDGEGICEEKLYPLYLL